MIQECGAHEHQKASAAEAIQGVVEIIVIRLVIVSRRRCGMLYGGSGFQCFQQIAKLHRCNRQFLPDDGANRLPQAFIRGWLALISIDRRNDQRAVGQTSLCVKLAQQCSSLCAGWTAQIKPEGGTERLTHSAAPSRLRRRSARYS